MWTVHLVRCHDVTLKNTKVFNNRQLPNTDGIVIDSCGNVAVNHVVIQHRRRRNLPRRPAEVKWASDAARR